MIFFSDVNYQNIFDVIDKSKIIKNNKGIETYNLPVSFDIETTSTIYNGDKVAFMYIWMFDINGIIIYGRTWEEFIEMLNVIKQHYELSVNKNLVIYIHNMGFEFQFMRKYFEWEDVFSIDERKPIKALTKDGFLFKDSYILSGYSLDSVAKNLQNHTVKKLVGSLDYDKVRTSKTIMTDKELSYCENDVVIVVDYIQEQIDSYGDITKIPLTNTGRVRDFVRDNCYYTSKNHRKSSSGKYKRYRKIMNDLILDVPTYAQLKRAFQGGYTHANANKTGKVLNDVASVDFTSSYPSVMVSEKFPMSQPIFKGDISIDEFNKYRRNYCMIFDIKFDNIFSTITQDNYISSSKCKNIKNAVYNNGRVFSAEHLETTITEIDLEIIEQCYEWEKYEVTNVTIFYKNYLPKPIIQSVIKLYQDKTQLKNVPDKRVEYMVSKGMLNSTYGMCVTDIIRSETTYEDDTWGSKDPDFQDEIDKYNKSRKRFLYYPWGVWITAYARRNLWTGIINVGDDYCYSDTDSIKIEHYDKHVEYINKYNAIVDEKINTMLIKYGFDQNSLKCKNVKGVEKPIGVWDFEGVYKKFKTLGAKRYIVYQNDELSITVAGLSKKNGSKYLLKQSDNVIDKAFEMFNDDMYVPSEETGKLTHTYIDDEVSCLIKDYKGHYGLVHTLSGVHLDKCEFTLSLTSEYTKFISMLSQGYIFKGVSATL